MKIKLETRIACYSYFHPLIICVIFRGGLWLDGVLSNIVEGDLLDELVSLLKSSSHYFQVNYVMLDFLNPKSFESINLEKLSSLLNKPVVAVSFDEFPNAVFLKDFNFYVKFVGLSLSDVRRLIKISMRDSNIPEPLRISRLLALSLLETLSF
ncbi:MAG: hypothetical protein DRJ21_00155 [Candidatus Methanomethylicota archaeon]|mgnify:CR=1 FL=1|uniref:Uncharacterized protein n=1 Tax=Thermoproteota archaeon TaxID=2056631 RepID=A0A497EW35_9CREN|nr:MAG: hypothetical protein DRJ21_00155 [Candidatus Verstraetearchaeota archaeon]